MTSPVPHSPPDEITLARRFQAIDTPVSFLAARDLGDLLAPT